MKLSYVGITPETVGYQLYAIGSLLEYGEIMSEQQTITAFYAQDHDRLVVLLAGGDKRTQTTDIKTALRLARNL